ncbi:MAG: DNA-binding response regulator [Myxococcales bacterium]|nr:MAG: DNA-binding response regulator [Myxococcales bacterium]
MAKILMIDDDRDLVDATRIVLESKGYQVFAAYNRSEGQKAVQTLKPDLILLDVMMEMEDDGFVLAQDLRRQGVNTPIIMLTNIGKVLGMEFGRDDEMAPVNEFTEKPLEPRKLLALVQKYVG